MGTNPDANWSGFISNNTGKIVSLSGALLLFKWQIGFWISVVKPEAKWDRNQIKKTQENHHQRNTKLPKYLIQDSKQIKSLALELGLSECKK